MALPAHEISIVINEMLINNQWPLTHREHEWPTNARASPLVEEAFEEHLCFLLVGARKKKFLSLVASRRTRADSTNEVTLERRARDFCGNLLQRSHTHTHASRLDG